MKRQPQEKEVGAGNEYSVEADPVIYVACAETLRIYRTLTQQFHITRLAKMAKAGNAKCRQR